MGATDYWLHLNRSVVAIIKALMSETQGILKVWWLKSKTDTFYD